MASPNLVMELVESTLQVLLDGHTRGRPLDMPLGVELVRQAVEGQQGTTSLVLAPG